MFCGHSDHKKVCVVNKSILDKLRQHATAWSILTTELIISFYELLYHMSTRILTNKSILEGKNNWNPSFRGAYIFTSYCILLVSSHGYYAWWVINLDFYIEIVHKLLIYFITVFMGFFRRTKKVLYPPKVMLSPWIERVKPNSDMHLVSSCAEQSAGVLSLNSFENLDLPHLMYSEKSLVYIPVHCFYITSTDDY